MKKSNVILQAAIASALLVMVGSANAGTLTAANTTFAIENFGATAPATTSITPGAVTYSMSTGTTVNPTSTIYFVIRLANAKFAAAPANTTFTFGGLTPTAGAAVGAGVGYTGTLSTDKTTLQVAITTGSASITLGLGAFTYTPAVGNIDSVNALATAGTSANATVAVTTTAAANAGALDSANALATTLDAPAPTTAIATSAVALTATVSALPTYTNKIDLTVTPVSSDYSLRVVGTNDGMALGSVTFSEVTGVQNKLAGGADYTLELGSAGTAATATITATPGAGQAFPVGATLWTDVTSDGCIIGNKLHETAAVTAATSTTVKSFTMIAAEVTTATPIFVCMSKPSATNTAAPVTATLVGTTVPAVAADLATSVTGTGYAVDYNGSTATVRNYVPAANVGFTEVVRVANTGSVAAPITVTMTSESGATIGVPYTTASLAAGATTRLTQAVIEAGVGGTLLSTDRPRLTITAPTNGMEVQTLMFSNGVYTNLSGKE